ncbi:hypothetical protein SAMN04515667_1983 [Formosa sp. Hel1_31_208]|uniref:DUF6090 family protein n=1 Tax=Formosa sp. Hel1_31_208 TaxID=1798225 RepID=UPI00087B3670|nr:DUF6090 family protein [Formosa sp. Hel1_31_208]SDS35344.1 hypothetical protein SAMN04515667_1983 [Formosa sp. Hel1_31_208]
MSKYIGYAIGEIVLVIIGILIALGINNWNQDKQLKRANVVLQQKVLKQLDIDIETISDFKKELDTLQQVYLKTLDRPYDKSKVGEEGLISTLLFEVNTLTLDNHIINLVDNAELEVSSASEQLIDLSSTYKIYRKDIDDIEKIIFEKTTNNLKEIEKTEDWYIEFITDFICKNDCINYLLNNKDHKARIASLRFLYIVGYDSIIDIFQNDLLKSKEQLLKALSK